MIQIAATSDWHGELPVIPECDLLLIAGDVCPDGAPSFQAKWLGGPFRKWLEAAPAKEVVLVAGNHDLVFEKGPPMNLPCHYLQDSAIELFGLKIYGTPWQLPFWGAFNLPEEELAKKYLMVPEQVDIFISHAPPYCIGDAVFSDDEVLHTGSPALRRTVLEIKPKLFVCGHIHEGYGVYKVEGVVFANACLLDDTMAPVHPVISFSMKNSSIVI